MLYVKNLLKENYMLIVLAVLLLCIAIFGTWGCDKMNNLPVEREAVTLY